MFIMANYISNTVLPLTMAYPAGWVLCTILLFFYYRKADLTKNAVVKPAKS